MAGDASGQRRAALTPARRRGGREEPETAEPSHNNGAASKPGPAQLMLDLDFVRGLIAAVDESGIDSLEINRAGTRIRISKSPTSAFPVPVVAPHPVPAQVPGTAATPAAAPAQTPAPEPPPAGPKKELVDVKSPMVGTFYRAPAPEAPPYVEIGSHVSKGQTLCILEAMKLMNELDSEVDGVVREILAENADPVEYGQVLFRIEPAGSGA
jgi:acetyl-CoA carboxylase biotin carboxyl carrier protein